MTKHTFLQNHAENVAGGLAHLFFKKAFYEVNASGLQLILNAFQ